MYLYSGDDEHMKLHPIVIIFCVAFFGFLWGPTGPQVVTAAGGGSSISPAKAGPERTIQDGSDGTGNSGVLSELFFVSLNSSSMRYVDFGPLDGHREGCDQF